MALSDRNVQAVVPAETHKILRDIAYVKGVPLRDLLRNILIEYGDSALAELKNRQDLLNPREEK